MKRIMILALVLSLLVIAGCCGIPDMPGPIGIPGI